MPGTDQSGYAGFSDQINDHYLAGQMVGQMTDFSGSGSYGRYRYYQPNQGAMAGEMAASAVSGQFDGLGQQIICNGLNRPPTIEIRPGWQINVRVTQDLVFAGPYGK